MIRCWRCWTRVRILRSGLTDLVDWIGLIDEGGFFGGFFLADFLGGFFFFFLENYEEIEEFIL